MVKKNGIDARLRRCELPEITGSIQCLLLQSVGNLKGPTGGNLLAKNHLHPTLKHQRGSCSHYLLLCGSDSARAIQG